MSTVHMSPVQPCLRHLRSTAPARRAAADSPVPPPAGEKAHACPICHKTFRMRSDMKRHIFTHSRDRPHPRSLRALNVQLGDDDEGVMLVDPTQLCLQVRRRALC